LDVQRDLVYLFVIKPRYGTTESKYLLLNFFLSFSDNLKIH
jgi:hypothetical protein